MIRRAFICGLSGTKLKKKEYLFIKKYKPWGIILFSRNIKSINQTRKLTSDIKKIFKDSNYPILIDEEGGRVSRLNKFIDNSKFSSAFFGKLYLKKRKQYNQFLNVYTKQVSYLLRLLNININTVPVLDIRRKNSHNVIGDRSYSSKSGIISKIGNDFIQSYHKNRIATVMKHIPGHGLALKDSHKETPKTKKNLKYLIKKDFSTFKKKECIFAMTAHMIYEKIDKHNCATHSKRVINIIRKKIGFKNLIISDDISMKALKYTIPVNTKKAFIAGCNLVLHCNGKYNEMLQVAKNSPFIDKLIKKKTSQFVKIIS